jgi:hypothetical protein
MANQILVPINSRTVEMTIADRRCTEHRFSNLFPDILSDPKVPSPIAGILAPVYNLVRTFSGSTPSGARVNDWGAATGIMNLFIVCRENVCVGIADVSSKKAIACSLLAFLSSNRLRIKCFRATKGSRNSGNTQMPHADVACSGGILTVEREEHGRGGWHNRLLGWPFFLSAKGA